MQRARDFYGKFLCCAMLLAVMLCIALHAHAQSLRIGDSLRQLYVSAIPAGDKYIVDAGEWKAILGQEGVPITPFRYKDLRAGLDGNFIASTDRGYFLLDASGNTLANFSGAISSVDTKRRQYVYRADQTVIRYDASGKEGERSYVEAADKETGLYRWQGDNGFSGAKDTSGLIVAPQIFDGAVSIGQRGVVGMKGDSAYVYSRAGILRFIARADEGMMLPHGVVALRLFGLWGLRDSTGKTIAPFKYFRIEQHQPDNIIQADNTILDYNGAILGKAAHEYLAQQTGGWIVLTSTDGTGSEVRDEHFNLVLKSNRHEQRNFIGDQFIRISQGYSDKAPRTYDRRTRQFTNYLVESALGGDAYVVYIEKTRERKILKGDNLLNLPRFTDVKQVDRFPFFTITNEGTDGRKYLEERDDHHSFFRSERPVNHPPYNFGLLDSAMRLIVPMAPAAIVVLGTELIVAYQPADSCTYLYSGTGKVLLKLRGVANAQREGAVVRMSTQSVVVLADTDGHVFYKGPEQPELLFPVARAEARTGLPSLLLYDDKTGYSGLYDLGGKQLLPHEYYAVTQRVPGLFSLKKGDSVYFANTHGRLLYGGRGFFGRKYFLLAGYSIIMQDGRGKWGVLGADGRQQHAFIYDSLIALQPQSGIDDYGLVQNGQYTLIDNTGRLRYPPQSWRPLRGLSPDYLLGNDSLIYHIHEGAAIALKPAEWGRALATNRQYQAYEFFREIGEGDVIPPGIYSRSMRLLAPHYRGFSYRGFLNKMVITESLLKHVAVIDTGGNVVVPFVDNPAAMLVSDSAVTALYRSGNDVLFHLDTGRYIRSEVRVDDYIREANQRDAGNMSVNWGTTISFVSRDGVRGILSPRGGLLSDIQIDSIAHGDYAWRIRRKGRWGLLDNNTVRYIHPPDADSISFDAEHHNFWIFKGRLRGLFHGDTRTYLPPVFSYISNPASLQYGFIVVKAAEGFTILGKHARRIAPFLDSISVDAWAVANAAAYLRGEEVSLSVSDDGNIRIDSGLSARVRRMGISGAFYTTVIMQDGDRQGLYSNESFSMVVPAAYDAIAEVEGGGFAIWRYKADKHEGMDSTLVADASGRIFSRLKGGYNPVRKKGFWYMRGELHSPVYNANGRLIVPEGYQLHAVYRERFFVVSRGGKWGILDDTGGWTTPLILDRIEVNSDEKDAFLAGQIEHEPDDKYCLIGPDGTVLTKAVYDEIRITDSGVLFKRGRTYGYFDAKGKETIRKWPVEEMDD